MVIDHRENDEFLEQARLDDVPQGLGIGGQLDNHLRFKAGSFNIILGHANVGKTYWVLWYFLALSFLHKKRHLIYSAENSINGLKRNLIELYMSKKIVKMTVEELDEAKVFIEAHFDFIDHKKIWGVQEFMSSVQAMDKTYDSIMIDPINAFKRPRGVNAHENDYETASKLRLYAKVFKTAIYVCMHASTEALRKMHPKDHEYEGHPVPPNGADAEGGGKWINRCDDFIVCHRYTQHEFDWMLTQIHIKKIKETETGGAPTFMLSPVIYRLDRGVAFLCKNMNSLERKVENSLNAHANTGF